MNNGMLKQLNNFNYRKRKTECDHSLHAGRIYVGLVDGLAVDGFVVGLAVDGLAVGILVDGLAVDGLAVDGLVVDG